MDRSPAVAGSFYPGEAGALRAQLDALLTSARPRGEGARRPKMIIAPHAGYVYSGTVAASAFAALRDRKEINRVVLVGPAHRMYFAGIAAPAADGFATPLGTVPIEAAPTEVIVSERAHAQEHSLEVEVPFLQAVLPSKFTLVPLLCGDVAPEEVAAVINSEWGGPETLIVISSDLSHYLPYDQARRVDGETVAHIGSLQADLTHEQACGATPVNAALMVAKQRGLTAELIDLRNSGDTAGDKSRVVGYCAFHIG